MKKETFNPNKTLLQNFMSLLVLHGLNYALPFLTVPFLVRVLEPEFYGLIAFSSSIISFLVLLTDYGFNLTATRDISLNRDNKKKLNEIFSSVLIIKFFIIIICFFFLWLSVNYVPKLNENPELYFLHFGMVIGAFLYPVWLFQGLEKMKYITFIDVGIKGFFTLSIFFLIKEPADFLIVPIIYSLSSIVSGLIALTFAYQKFNLKFKVPSFIKIKNYFIEGWHIFISNIGINLYTNGTIFILGFLTNNTVVGYFAAAEKIVRAARKIYAPIGQALFPSVGYRIQKDRNKAVNFIKKSSLIVSLIMLIISSFMFFYAKDVVQFILGSQYDNSIILLKVMSFIPLTYSINNILGVQTLINLGLGKIYGIVISIISVLGLLTGYVLINKNGVEGAAYNLLLVELLTLLSLISVIFIFLIRKKSYPST